MAMVRWAPDGPEIDATVAARGMKLAVEYFLRQIQQGHIRCLVERGVGDDEGRHRLSFKYRDRELLLIVADDGQVLSEELTMAPRKFVWK